jgi:hypothetical protein
MFHERQREVKMPLYKIACFMLLLFTLLLLVWAPDPQAPEITGRDVFGFAPYRIAADGAIVDSDRAVRGWIRDKTVYDAQWNVRYRINANRLCKVNEDVGL